jgi:hypothetical protein
MKICVSLTLSFTFLWRKHASPLALWSLNCKLFWQMISKCQIHDNITKFVISSYKSRRFICWLQYDDSCFTMLVYVASNALDLLLRFQFQLNGSIPPSNCYIPKLNVLDLSNNNLSGNLVPITSTSCPTCLTMV